MHGITPPPCFIEHSKHLWHVGNCRFVFGSVAECETLNVTQSSRFAVYNTPPLHIPLGGLGITDFAWIHRVQMIPMEGLYHFQWTCHIRRVSC